MTLDNCTFIGNSATTYDGGAIHTENQASRTITNCVFINNKANRNAGAILLYGSSSTVNNCTFISNIANSNGGALYIGSAAKITSSLFKYNTAGIASVLYSSVANTNLTDSVILDNVATGSGQYTIYSSVANTIANNNWFGNTLNDKTTTIPKVYRTTLTNWYFLDIDVNEQFLYTNGTSNITFSLNRYYNSESGHVVKGNFKYPDIVKLNITSRDDMLGFNNITLDENKEYLVQIVYIPEIGVYNITATYMGVTARNAVYYVPPDSFTALNHTIALNYNNNLVLNHSYRYYDEYDFNFLDAGIIIKDKINISGNAYTIDAKGKTRIFRIESTDVLLDNLTLINGFAGGGALFINSNNVIINNSNFRNNIAHYTGGAVYVASDNVYIMNSNFSDNHVIKTDGWGGALYWVGLNGVLINSNFDNNSALTQGGAIFWRGDNGKVDFCNFTNNHADSVAWSGGAIRWQAQSGIINNSNFKNNSAIGHSTTDAGDGGAVSIYQSSNTIVDYCNFTDNRCSGIGAALAINAGDKVKVLHSNFINNIEDKFGGPVSEGKGGAIFMQATNFLINECSFLNNFAYSSGAGIFTTKGGEISSCIFINNTSPTGPVLYATANGVVISDCIILNNKATSTVILFPVILQVELLLIVIGGVTH